MNIKKLLANFLMDRQVTTHYENGAKDFADYIESIYDAERTKVIKTLMDTVSVISDTTGYGFAYGLDYGGNKDFSATVKIENGKITILNMENKNE